MWYGDVIHGILVVWDNLGIIGIKGREEKMTFQISYSCMVRMVVYILLV